MTQERPRSLTILAWFLIIVNGLSASINAYAIATGIPPYPLWLWTLMGLAKILVVIAAFFLLRMQKLAIWIFVMATVLGWSLSIGFAGRYTPVAWWNYAIGLVLIGIYVAIVAPHWSKLRSTSGARANA